MDAAENGYTEVAETLSVISAGDYLCSTRFFYGRTLWEEVRVLPCIKTLWTILLLLFYTSNTSGVSGLGSISTIAVSYDGNGGGSVCAITQGRLQTVQCWSSLNISAVSVSPSEVPFSGISGGRGILCGLRADTGRPICWNINNFSSPRRLKNQAFHDIVAGDSLVCALSQGSSQVGDGSLVACWRNANVEASIPRQFFSSLSSGADFVCGLTFPNNTVQCWGNSKVNNPPNANFSSIQAGSVHACGITDAFNVQCWGDDTFGQLRVPNGRQFLSLALGERHSCGVDAFTRNVVCWGDDSLFKTSPPANLSFSAISAGDSFTCGVVFDNFSVVCWGSSFRNGTRLPLGEALPSACTTVPCDEKSYMQPSANSSSSSICSSAQSHVCIPCRVGCQSSFIQTAQCLSDHDISCGALPGIPSISSQPPASTPTTVVMVVTRNRLSKGLIVLLAFGAAGILCGLLTIGWCVWAKCCGPVGFMFDGSQGRVHHSPAAGLGDQPTLITMKRQRSSTSFMKRQRSSTSFMRRQRSSTSSVRSRGDITTGGAQAFTISEMTVATMGFSEENIIAVGSFGVVYKGMLADGREVAIKRREKESVANEKKMEEKESAFQSELEFLSRLHHKHLVSLVGFCNEEDERMLVYDYMPNGTLHDHLHGNNKAKGGNGALPWQMRVKIALEAARGVEYLHTYALPPIIHRDIKSSNILLDAAWCARVSDFGLSTRGPADNSHLSLMAAGTLGYMDPEYYRLQHLTIKSDVYSFGVVLLELLTGERAIHRQSHGPVNIVDYAIPKIEKHDLASVLDQRPGAPTPSELKAMESVARLAAQCVRLEGKERPTMTEIVAVLEEAMACSSNGQSRSQSLAVASLSNIPFDTNGAAPFEPLQEAFDTMTRPFESVRVEEMHFTLEGEGKGMSTFESDEAAGVNDPLSPDLLLLKTSEEDSRARIDDFQAASGSDEKHFPDVPSASDLGTASAEITTDTTYGGSGGAGSSNQ